MNDSNLIQDIADYRSKGFLIIENALSKDIVDDLLNAQVKATKIIKCRKLRYLCLY